MRPLVPVLLISVAACTGQTAAGPAASSQVPPPTDAALVELPKVSPAPAGELVALVDDRGGFATVDLARGAQVASRQGWEGHVALDGSLLVSTAFVGPGDTKIVWDALPSGEVMGATVIEGIDLVATASGDDGLAAFTTRAAPVVDGNIAGARDVSTIVIAGAESGEVYRTELKGNFVPEAFGRRPGADGLPAQLFLLEYFPADAPRFYRVRVLSTETGEVSLPVNLRNKTQLVDERMAGFTRSQVVADEQGLLFTLYRGTIDGTVTGAPYAFIHTLDFADGVWCLDVDPELELDTLPGTLAVGGDRLYVASANGKVASFEIPSIIDPGRSPDTGWVRQVGRSAETAPPMLADDDGVWIGPADGASRLVRLDTLGALGTPLGLPGSAPVALAHDRSGDVQALGAGWSTLGDVMRPGWLGAITRLVIG